MKDWVALLAGVVTLVTFILTLIFDKKGELKAKAQKALDLARQAREESLRAQENLAAGKIEEVEIRVVNLLTDLAALKQLRKTADGKPVAGGPPLRSAKARMSVPRDRPR